LAEDFPGPFPFGQVKMKSYLVGKSASPGEPPKKFGSLFLALRWGPKNFSAFYRPQVASMEMPVHELKQRE